MIYYKQSIKYTTNRRMFFILILVTGYLNTILRISPDSGMTLFRILAPILFIEMLINDKKNTYRFSVYILLLISYAYIISYLPFNRFEDFNVVFTLHYILVLFSFAIIKYLIDKLGVEYLYIFFKRIYFLMIILAFIQLYFGGIYPNTQDRLPKVNIFFWNENEFSAVLAIFIPLFFLKEKNSLFKYLWLFAGVFFIVYSYARILIIGGILFFLIYSLTRMKLYKYKFLWVFGVIAITYSIFYFTKSFSFFGDYNYSSMFLDPLNRIVTLNPYENIGSIGTRINSYIYGFIELKNTYFFGIGPGNSLTLMKENIPVGMEKYSAESFHNIILQLMIELGIVGIAIFSFLIKLMINTIRSTKYNKFVVSGYFLISLLFSTILSGAFSNYAFMFIFAFSIYAFKCNKFIVRKNIFEK